MLHKRLPLAVLLLTALAAPALAFEAVESGPLYWRFSGYVKSFTSLARSGDLYRQYDLTTRETFWNNRSRARLRSQLSLADVFEFVVHYEAVNQYGDTQRLQTLAERRFGGSPFTAPIVNGLFPNIRAPQLFDLDHQIYENDEELLTHRLDRLYGRFHAGPWDVTLGRATLTWGPGRIWNPTDYLAAFSPTEIDKEEKPGVDLAHARVALADGVSFEGFGAPVRQGESGIDGRHSAAAGRLNVTVLHADWGLSGGWLYDRSTMGFDMDASIGGAGVRGAITRAVVEGVPGEAFYRAIVNADYGFPWRWNPYLAGEYYYNGFGETNPKKYVQLAQRPAFARAFQRGEALNYGVHYLGVIATLQPHPLVTLSETAIVNLLDGSAVNIFLATWAALQNLDLQLGAQNTFGPIPSEFGGLTNPLTGQDIAAPDSYFAYLKFYF
jgi:hypothetical protein